MPSSYIGPNYFGMVLNVLDMDQKPKLFTEKSFLVQSKVIWTGPKPV